MAFYGGSRLVNVYEPPASSGEPWMLDWGGTQRFTMEFTRPHSTMDTNDRWRAAYPGLEYNVRAAVIGGVYPYLYELVNAPAWMSINSFTGTISGTPTAGTYSNIQIRATDTKGTTVLSAAWTITCATTRFRFFDATNGNSTWNGLSPTFVSGTTGPKRTMADFWTIGSSTLIGYFLNGTYTNAGLTAQSDGIRWTVGTNRPSIWLAYDGHSPLVDFEHDEGVVEAAQWDFGEGGNTPRAYLDGLEFYRSGNKCIRVWGCDNLVVRRCHFHHAGPGAQSANSALAIDYESGSFSSGTWDRHVIQDNEFNNYIPPLVGIAPNCVLKMYATSKALIENNLFHDLDIGGEDEEAISNKAGNNQITVRGNIAYDMAQGVFGGNHNSAATGQYDFEFCFNRVKNTSRRTILVNHDHTSNAPSYLYRNTFEGDVVWDELQTQNGPYTFDRNVVINGNAATDNPNGSGITHAVPPQDISRILHGTTVFGNAAAGIIDSNGLLTSAYESSRYYYGHQVPA